MVLTKRAGEPPWLADAALIVFASFLFHRLVACRVRPHTLFVAALLAGTATTSLFVAIELDPHSPFAPRPGHAPFPSMEHPNQLRVFLPVVVGWCATLLPLFFARALVAASENSSSASPDRRPGR